ncbi:MAG: NRDE family protein, partial [Syntrophales bacterium]|nr:NRDE family protein [Syntrophales bacterium]
MCLIILAYGIHPVYPVIMAANRDEFYDRPSAPADFWPERPDILAGRDLQEGGTWCGVTTGGKFAALTNYRDPLAVRAGAPSRGDLVRRYLAEDITDGEFIGYLREAGGTYNGFSIIFGSVAGLFYYSNRGAEREITPGIHGLSNALLDAPWP